MGNPPFRFNSRPRKWKKKNRYMYINPRKFEGHALMAIKLRNANVQCKRKPPQKGKRMLFADILDQHGSEEKKCLFTGASIIKRIPEIDVVDSFTPCSCFDEDLSEDTASSSVDNLEFYTINPDELAVFSGIIVNLNEMNQETENMIVEKPAPLLLDKSMDILNFCCL